MKPLLSVFPTLLLTLACAFPALADKSNNMLDYNWQNNILCKILQNKYFYWKFDLKRSLLLLRFGLKKRLIIGRFLN